MFEKEDCFLNLKCFSIFVTAMNFFTIYNFIRIRLESVVITVVALDKLCETMQSQEVSENNFGSKAALLIYKFIIIIFLYFPLHNRNVF